MFMALMHFGDSLKDVRVDCRPRSAAADTFGIEKKMLLSGFGFFFTVWPSVKI
jgi:hypothetical protein